MKKHFDDEFMSFVCVSCVCTEAKKEVKKETKKNLLKCIEHQFTGDELSQVYRCFLSLSKVFIQFGLWNRKKNYSIFAVRSKSAFFLIFFSCWKTDFETFKHTLFEYYSLKSTHTEIILMFDFHISIFLSMN